MKRLIVFLLLVTNSPLFAQTSTRMENWRQEIWNSVVNAIIDFDQEKIYQMTNFPLEGDWYSQEGQTLDKLKALYKSGLEYFYPQEMRDLLKKKDFASLIVHSFKEDIAFAFIYTDQLLETITIVDFAEVADEWKIVAITIK